ncbi:hypothetical protein AgCh_024869 [Apium graveolens]
MYEKGKENVAADALSRIHGDAEFCTIVHYVQPQWKTELTESFTDLRKRIITTLHSSTEGGHSGVEGLPKSRGKDTILVVVDRFTKYSHLISLTQPYTASKIAQEFMDNVVKLHGVPQVIISDRDPIFVSLFRKELFTSLGTQVMLSTAYHPQTDGQTERVNQCIEMFLRCMDGHKPGTWAVWLSLAEWWYNTSYHSALNMSPFQALHSTRPPSINFSLHRTNDAEVNEFLKDREATQQLIKDNLIKAQERMKWYSDKKRTDRSFIVNDLVYLKLQPYRQQSVNERRNHKLSAKFYGPFTVIEKIGQVAYKLDLPYARIHNIFHVSQLKKKIESNKDIQIALPTVADTGSMDPQPIVVLERKLIKKGNNPVVMVLVQWENGTCQKATWER